MLGDQSLADPYPASASRCLSNSKHIYAREPVDFISLLKVSIQG